MSQQYNFDAARGEAHLKNMQELQAENKCFMCYENLIDYSRNPIIFETDHWIITPNAYPYKHTSLHLLLISRRHARSLAELTADERSDLTEAVVRVEKQYQLDSYTFVTRNGDFRFNGGSVEHLHAHIVVGERDPETFMKVRFKVTSLPDQD